MKDCKNKPEKLEKTPLWPMDLAIDMAQKARDCGEVPVGAVLVKAGHIVASAHNQMNALGNPLAHAEMVVIIQGMRLLSSKYLTDCHLYVTLQPCDFCMQGLIMARIGRVYFGAYDTSLPVSPSFESIGGIQEHACQEILHQFFYEKRR